MATQFYALELIILFGCSVVAMLGGIWDEGR